MIFALSGLIYLLHKDLVARENFVHFSQFFKQTQRSFIEIHNNETEMCETDVRTMMQSKRYEEGKYPRITVCSKNRLLHIWTLLKGDYKRDFYMLHPSFQLRHITINPCSSDKVKQSLQFFI